MPTSIGNGYSPAGVCVGSGQYVLTLGGPLILTAEDAAELTAEDAVNFLGTEGVALTYFGVCIGNGITGGT